MPYQFRKMTQYEAEEIAYQWKYPEPYSFYDMTADPEDLEEFLDSKERGESYFSVYDGQELIGFWCATQPDQTAVEIGLGMKPEITGKGKGIEFIKAGIAFTEMSCKSEKIVLSVAAFNKRAIRVYQQAGFKTLHYFNQDTNGSTYSFVKMELLLK
ncbi:GNAT family N-acetyltransferase [Sediminibacillus massiliensis]|uniref:GNAT family N-acetyltransferase n=1 Tax=Sediminibacillus massiliensis TaxID=1926277 RepID=UPI000988646A|nr:GNAT family protein [Sediminibacillus massiliensis]